MKLPLKTGINLTRLKSLIFRIYNSSTSKEVFQYSIFSFLGKSIPFLILPYLTKILLPSDFGFIAEFNYYNLAMMIILGLGSNSVILQLYYDKIFENKQTLYLTFNLFLIINSIIITIAILCANIFFEINNVILIYTLIISIFTISNNIFSTILQIEKKIIQLGISQLISSVISILVAIILIKFFNFKWQGRVIGILVSVLSINLYYAFKFLKISPIEIDLIIEGVRKFYSLGLKIFPSLVVGWFFINSDKYILSLKDNKDNLGRYSIIVSISQISELLFNSFSLALIPNLLNKMNNKKTTYPEINKYINNIIIVFIFLTIIISFFLPFFYNYYVRESFQVSNYILLILISGYTFIAINSIFTTYHLKLMKNSLISKISLYTLFISLLPIYLIISKFYIIGAALSFLLINFIQFLFLYYNYKKYKNEFTTHF